MTKYAKEVDNVLQHPTPEEFRGVPNYMTHDVLMRRHGYKPMQGEPEPREGYTARPSAWHIVAGSETRIEPRREDPVTREPFMEDIMEEDPETHEMKKVGERQVTREVPVTYDKSYIQIDAWNYIPIPAPEPPPLKRRFSKGDLLEALMACNLYEQAKAVYANDMDLQIAWAGFADIDMDYSACKGIMQQYPELFSEQNVLALQRYITFGPEQQDSGIVE